MFLSKLLFHTLDYLKHVQHSISHQHASNSLCKLADELCDGGLVVMGGGCYNRTNIANTWTTVVQSLISNS
ncbi:hypothetical protein MNBD_GAMMA22-1386 [hydrothermal vent metagenome]|uniref:Uncharacterized protein n=1 Tax=hydrothermal vent metagenome TaxID=652676 RepID=A0A3B1B1N1_9ZZZZ